MKTLPRITLQLALTAWLALFIPIMLGMIGDAVTSLVGRTAAHDGPFKAILNVWFASSPLSALALFVSIVVPAHILKRRRWLFYPILALLISGCIIALLFLRIGVGAFVGAVNWPNGFFVVWMFGGPLGVAIWNIVRLIKAPN